MLINALVEIHYSIQEIYPLSARAAQVVAISPESILGITRLLKYDILKGKLKLTYAFKTLLKRLLELDQVNEALLKAATFQELNDYLQKEQGFQGGLLRKEGIERWHLQDNQTLKAHQDELENLFEQMGLVNPVRIKGSIAVNHCIVFGARSK